MKASYHLRILEQVTWSSGAKLYLIQCLERLVIAQAGCYDVLQPAEEVRAACLYVNTYHRKNIDCVQVLKADMTKFIRLTLLQRKFKTMLNVFTHSVGSLTGTLLNRTMRPPALPRTKESSILNTVP